MYKLYIVATRCTSSIYFFNNYRHEKISNDSDPPFLVGTNTLTTRG